MSGSASSPWRITGIDVDGVYPNFFLGIIDISNT